MFPAAQPTVSLLDRLTRRELLRLGSLTALGLGADDLARLRADPAPSPAAQRRRRHPCVFLFLFGGPTAVGAASRGAQQQAPLGSRALPDQPGALP